jgi:hypothetical protein
VDHAAVVAGLVIGQTVFFLNQQNVKVGKAALHFVKGSSAYYSSSYYDDVK